MLPSIGRRNPAPDWGFNNTTEYMKHSDCDGNGIIDNNDPNAILINYGETHGTLVPAESILPTLS
ncbi:MAG: hypothetical protein IPL35_17840 [Sphingobacteriales bacterium]|nr:hypothetical protein [Sphingobacteriales bacterium]